MQTYKARCQESLILQHLSAFPAVALLGARQVGKSTLAKKVLSGHDNAIYLDLENPRDLAKLQDPLTFLEANSGSLICIDEVQLQPDLFQVLRSYLDTSGRPGQFAITWVCFSRSHKTVI